MSLFRFRVTRYGYLGLLPFFFIASAVWVLPDAKALSASVVFVSYSSVIISFLGGILWGAGLSHQPTESVQTPLIDMGIVASLLPWLSLAVAILLATPHILLGCVVVNAACLYFLRKSEIKHLSGHYDSWFDELRALLSKVVLACHFSVGVFCLVFESY